MRPPPGAYAAEVETSFRLLSGRLLAVTRVRGRSPHPVAPAPSSSPLHLADRGGAGRCRVKTEAEPVATTTATAGAAAAAAGAAAAAAGGRTRPMSPLPLQPVLSPLVTLSDMEADGGVGTGFGSDDGGWSAGELAEIAGLM